MMRSCVAALVPFAMLAGAAAAQDATVLKGQDAFGSWQDSRPGVTRLIRPEDLPKPGATQSASNAPATVSRPQDAAPVVPDGFRAELVAGGLEEPRAIRFAPNGDLFVADSGAGEIHVFRMPEGSGKPAADGLFAGGLDRPYGIAFYPADNPQWVYVAEADGLKRFPYKAGDLQASGDPETLLSGVPSDYHWTRDIAFSPDGGTLFYSVGSGSNYAEGVLGSGPEGGLDAWAASHPLGAVWGAEARRADVLALDPDGSNERVFATGLRNCSGMTIQPATGDLWCVVNERDALGDNLPPDYATHVAQGAFYGWPWYYIGSNPDPRWSRMPREDLAGKVTVPDVLFQAHSAPLNIAFYDSDAFGPDYRGDAFVAMHGSWNRGNRTGYKVVRLLFDDSGKATGEYQDFATGFITDNGDVWGRPVGVAVAPDGSLYVSEDGSGTIWRISRN